ncbi:hypothetical protein A4G20_10220 [Pasteurellaceae bacterium RH1A]|nr:hypothetical protein A4G20_10220 [Pasteurellaceae bacterium RH1A]
MSIFTQIFSQKPPLVQIGLSEDKDQFCLVKQEGGLTKTQWFEKKKVSADKLLQKMEGFKHGSVVVRAIPHQYIWRKYLLLPASQNHNLIYRQVIQQLKQDLPLKLEDIYFDYQITPLKNQGLQVIIYALAKGFANQFLTQPKLHLDCEWHCLQRAYHFLAQEKPKKPFATGYLFKNQILEFKTEQAGLMPLKKEAYFERFYTYQKSGFANEIQIDIMPDITKPELYLTALGASLWNMPSA